MLCFDCGLLRLIIIGAAHEISALLTDQLATAVDQAAIADRAVEHGLFGISFAIRLRLTFLLGVWGASLVLA